MRNNSYHGAPDGILGHIWPVSCHSRGLFFNSEKITEPACCWVSRFLALPEIPPGDGARFQILSYPAANARGYVLEQLCASQAEHKAIEQQERNSINGRFAKGQ